MAKKSIVKINIKKHDVTVEDELVVNIRHNKDCSAHCSDTEYIVNYLLDEMFVADGFVVTSER